LKLFEEGEWSRRENYGKDKPNQGIIYVLEMSQQNPLHNYHILVKMFLKTIFKNFMT
jgi:hypothetical protein